LIPVKCTPVVSFPAERIAGFLRSKRSSVFPFLWIVFLQKSFDFPLIQTGPKLHAVPGEPTSAPKGGKRAQQVYNGLYQFYCTNVYTGPENDWQGPNNVATLRLF
jgi:hypothetical protein